MKKTIIAAISENHVLGKDGGLVWSLPKDRQWLIDHCADKFLIMGRRSYDENVVDDFFPGSHHVVITRREGFQAKNSFVVHSIEAAYALANELSIEEVIILGGGTIYKKTIEDADVLIITEVKVKLEGDTFFPEIDLGVWKEVSRETHVQDAQHAYDFDFVKYVRK